jgi:hypothetical protein
MMNTTTVNRLTNTSQLPSTKLESTKLLSTKLPSTKPPSTKMPSTISHMLVRKNDLKDSRDKKLKHMISMNPECLETTGKQMRRGTLILMKLIRSLIISMKGSKIIIRISKEIIIRKNLMTIRNPKMILEMIVMRKALSTIDQARNWTTIK